MKLLLVLLFVYLCGRSELIDALLQKTVRFYEKLYSIKGLQQLRISFVPTKISANEPNISDVHNDSTNALAATRIYDNNKNNISEVDRRGWLKKMLSSSVSSVVCLQFNNKYAWAINDNDDELTKRLKSSLQPATQSMPAIPFPVQNENEAAILGTPPTAVEGTSYTYDSKKIRKMFFVFVL
jgi:hypothetical protein